MASQAVRSFNRLFISNLPWTVSHRELAEYFSQFGHLSSSRVIFDKSTGLSMRYGFVEFTSKNSMENACNKKDHVLEGNYLNVQVSH